MSEEQSFLEQLPQAAVEVRDGKITALNSAALSHLPELAVGDQPPQYLAAPLDSAQTAGAFTGGGGLFVFSKVSSPGGVLLLFRPAPDSALSPQQMDGFARQLREQMGGLLNNLQLLSQDLSGTGSPPTGGWPPSTATFIKCSAWSTTWSSCGIPSPSPGWPFPR